MVSPPIRWAPSLVLCGLGGHPGGETGTGPLDLVSKGERIPHPAPKAPGRNLRLVSQAQGSQGLGSHWSRSHPGAPGRSRRARLCLAVPSVPSTDGTLRPGVQAESPLGSRRGMGSASTYQAPAVRPEPALSTRRATLRAGVWESFTGRWPWQGEWDLPGLREGTPGRGSC